MPIEKKHLEKNEELFFWISEETDLKDVIMVEKSKSKYEGIEEGMVRAQSLYHIGKELKKAVYATVCCESKSEEEVKKQTKLVGIANQENISYPAFIENIYRGLMWSKNYHIRIYFPILENRLCLMLFSGVLELLILFDLAVVRSSSSDDYRLWFPNSKVRQLSLIDWFLIRL